MIRYIARRLVQGLFVVIGVTLISFGVLFLSGDPTALLLGDKQKGMSREQIAEFRSRMGFDRPWIVQYLEYMARASRGDFGDSYYHGVPNFNLIAEYLPATLELGGAALLFSLIVAIPAGVLAASQRGRPLDTLVMLGALFGQALPVFWLGLMLMLVFAVSLRWFPVSGRGGLTHLVLPAVTLAAFSIAQNARMIRSSMLEVLGQDFILTVRAKGLPTRVILYKHALKNAMIPVITLIAIQVGTLLGGAVITETIFAWPGIGRLIVQAIYTKDIPLVQASLIMLALVFVAVNLAVDLVYAYFDPRIRYA
jgi:peptide/nickel transport system permease protein